MRSVWIAFFTLSGLLMIPTSPSAAGGLLSSVKESVEDVIDETVNVSNHEHSEDEKKSFLEETASEVVQIADSVVKPVTEKVEEVVPKTEINLSAAKISTSDEGTSIQTPVADVKVSSEEGVSAETVVGDVKASLSEGVSVDTPVADLEVSESLNVKVDTAVAKVESSLSEGVSVDTPVADVEVSESLEVKVDPDIVGSSVSADKAKVETKPIPSTDIEEAPVEESFNSKDVAKEEAVVSVETEQKPDSSSQMEQTPAGIEPPMAIDGPTKVEESIESDQAATISKDQVNMALDQPMPVSENDQPFFTPSFHFITTTQTTTGGPANGPTNSVGASTSAVFGALFTNEYMDQLNGVVMLANVRMYYDQWLNAPPSQPPKQPSFFATS